ncbi:MAG TPA: CAP domain-containing protein [Candidatus Limnocylindria bacterium]|jgi:uncharacterized protein YkwD
MRTRSRAWLGALIVALVCSVGLAGQAAAGSPAGAGVAATSVQAGGADVVLLVNAYRAANGLGPVAANGSLASAAAWMANDLATKSYFSHISSDGRSPQQRMAAFGYPAYALYTGENIAGGQPTAADVVAGWKASPAHNAILLSASFDAIGVGYAYNAASTYKSYWVADLGGPGGNRAAVAPPPVAIVVAPPPAPSAPSAAPATADGTGPTAPGTDARASTVARGEPRDADAPATMVSDGFAMRRLLHLLEVLDRLDRRS